MNKDAYIIIYHKWWVDSGHFEEEVITGKTRSEVEEYAQARCYKRQDIFSHWAFHIVKAEVEITTNPKPRRLTWWERISGRVKEE